MTTTNERACNSLVKLRDEPIKPVQPVGNCYQQTMARCELSEVSEKTQSFYLKIPGEGRMESCLVTFTPEGIVIHGDLTPCRNGVISCYGKGINWFRGELSPCYLAEKFLEKGFHAKEAAKEMRDHQHWIHGDPEDDLSTPLTAEDWEKEVIELCDDLEYGDCTHQDLYEWLSDRDIDTDDIPGWTYNPRDVKLLSAIQERFAELYNAMRASETTKAGES